MDMKSVMLQRLPRDIIMRGGRLLHQRCFNGFMSGGVFTPSLNLPASMRACERDDLLEFKERLGELNEQYLEFLQCCFAGYDSLVVSQRARCTLESELQISAGCHLYIHGLHPDRSQPLCIAAPHLWGAHDGAVQGPQPWRIVAPCVRHC